MQKNVLFFLMCLVGFTTQTSAQYITKEQYIQMHKDFAIREMKRMGVPASITLAQGLLETENGNSILVKKSNNHFGIKCKSGWTSGSVSHDDDAPGECFRSYKDAEASYRDHSNFLRGNQRYAFLFKYDPKDYKSWAHGLKKAGYATNPKYPQMLIKYIEEHNLQQYTLEAIDEVPVFDPTPYKDDVEAKSTASIPETNALDIKLTVNGLKVINADKGTSLLAIATHHNIKLQKLLDYNDLEEDGILEADQFIFLERKAKEGERDFVILRAGETLYDVAQNNGVQFDYVLEYNGLTQEQQLPVGSKVYLRPVKKDLAAVSNRTFAPTTGANDVAVRTHSVQPKEGLYAISKKYGVTVAQLKDWNGLVSDDLRVGQELIISK
jgi:LysM repeat protein